jgi:nicotinamidase-related amidase
MCDELGMTKIAFADCHTESSPEFDSYPKHCIAGTLEGEMVDEIKEIGGYFLIPKNSTNGFLEGEFQKWLEGNQQIDTFIMTGDCTDICIQQFAVTIKAWFNMHNKKVRVIVPIDTVETYDLGLHNADLMNMMALYSMIGNGIEVVKGIK